MDLGAVTAILWYVPYLGPILAGVPPVLDAFVTCVAVGGDWHSRFVAFVIVEGYFVVPVVMGRSMELNATAVMLACLFWELVWGTSGLFLAMPLMAVLKTICTHVPDWQPWANLMSTRDEPPPLVGKLLGPEEDMEETQRYRNANWRNDDNGSKSEKRRNPNKGKIRNPNPVGDCRLRLCK